MRPASAGLLALLNSTTAPQFLMADLYTLTLNGGFVVRYTSADTNITSSGNVFSKFLISRSRTKISVGLEVDTLDVLINAATTDLLNGTAWLTAVRAGALDGAKLQLEKVFMPTWGDTSLGTIVLFQGRVADVQVSRTEAKLQVKSELELLDIQLPRNFYQSGCLLTLFDNACGLLKSNYVITGAVATGTTVSVIKSGLTQADGYFSLGTIVFITGVNAGITRSVRSHVNAGGALTLALPLITAPAVGDTFNVYPGCDKTQSTCTTKFSNLVNFKGFPYVPDPEVAT